MAKISVIVPIYNVKEYLKTSIGSIKDQSFDDFECLLVDDGSTDGSGLLAEVLARGDARFTVYHKLNGGLSDARNYGLERAKGEFVLFFDSDDALDPKCLQYCFTAMKRDHLDMVIFDYNQNWVQQNRKEVISNKYPEGTVTSLGKDHALMTKIANAAWNKMYRRNLFMTTGIRYPKGHIYEDLGTTYRLLYHANRVGFIRTPLYDYTVDRSGNITSSINLEKCKDVLYEAKLNSDYYQKLGVFETYYEELKYLSGINIMETLRKCIQLPYDASVADFVDACFDYLKQNYTEFPSCIYDLTIRKDDWIYTNRYILKAYLMLRNKIKG